MIKWLKNIFYILFIAINYYIYDFTNHIQSQDKCECRTGWKIENLKLLSLLCMIMGIANLLIPLNKVIYNIPLISGIFSIGLLILLFVELFSLVRLCRNLVNNKECSETCQVEGFENLIKNSYNLSISICIGIAIVIAIGLLYL
jgi:hypothetical protein